jgi:hypothetical protein
MGMDYTQNGVANIGSKSRYRRRDYNTVWKIVVEVIV